MNEETFYKYASRSPHGERGLKYLRGRAGGICRKSLSSWRAWIEIANHLSNCRRERSLSSWRAWIEILRCPLSNCERTSRSPHGERGLKSW